MTEQELREQLQSAQSEAAVLRETLQEIVFLIESLDVQLERIPGDDGFIAGYRMNTGIWHRLLALARGVPSGDAGAAYLAELQAARRVVEAARSVWDTGDGELYDDAAIAALTEMIDAIEAYDALSATATEPEKGTDHERR